MSSSKARVLRHSVSVAFIVCTLLIMLAVIKRIAPEIIRVLETGSEQEIQSYIYSFGSAKGMLFTYLLQFMQIISIFLPGGPIQIAAGIVFGKWRGFGVCHLGYVSANTVIFSVSRKLGKKMDELFPIPEKQSRLNFISGSDHPAFMVFLACLVPFVPNGIIPHIASKSGVSYKNFIIAVCVGCAPTIFLLCAVGSNIMEGDYYTAAFLFGALIVGILILYFKRDGAYAKLEALRQMAIDKFGIGTHS